MTEYQLNAEITLIRPLASHDLAPVFNLIRLVPEAPRWTVSDFQKLANASGVDQQGSRLTRMCFVAECKAHLVGVLVMQVLRVREGSVEAEVECELETIMVHPKARRAGNGWLLLRAALEACRREGASVLRLEVRIGNAAAIRLYERAGFALTGRRPRYYSNPEEDALLMKLAFPK